MQETAVIRAAFPASVDLLCAEAIQRCQTLSLFPIEVLFCYCCECIVKKRVRASVYFITVKKAFKVSKSLTGNVQLNC